MKLRIVLAEDEPDLRVAAVFRLKAAGFAVFEAEDGRRALELIRARRPDLALMDVRMPQLTGVEVCRALKADPGLKDIPVILMTASTEHLQERVAEAGAQAAVSKPFNSREMIALIHRLSGQPQPA